MYKTNSKLADMPLKERIIHVLAAEVTALDKIRLIKRLQQEGMEKSQGRLVSTVLMNVGTNVNNKFTLKRSLWRVVSDNWPFYTDEERVMVRNNKSKVMQQLLDDSENSRSPDSDESFGRGVKRSFTEIDPTAKRARGDGHGRKMYTGAKIPAATNSIYGTMAAAGYNSSSSGYSSSTSSKHPDSRQSSTSPNIYALANGVQELSTTFNDDHGEHADQTGDNLFGINRDRYKISPNSRSTSVSPNNSSSPNQRVASNINLSPNMSSSTGRNSRNGFSNGPSPIRNGILQSSPSANMPSNNFVNRNHVSPNLRNSFTEMSIDNASSNQNAPDMPMFGVVEPVVDKYSSSSMGKNARDNKSKPSPSPSTNNRRNKNSNSIENQKVIPKDDHVPYHMQHNINDKAQQRFGSNNGEQPPPQPRISKKQLKINAREKEQARIKLEKEQVRINHEKEQARLNHDKEKARMEHARINHEKEQARINHEKEQARIKYGKEQARIKQEKEQARVNRREKEQSMVNRREKEQPMINHREKEQLRVGPQYPRASPHEREQPRFSPRERELSRISPRQREQPRISPREIEQPRVSPREREHPRISPNDREQPMVSPRQRTQNRSTPYDKDQSRISPREQEFSRISSRDREQSRISPREHLLVSPDRMDHQRVTAHDALNSRFSPRDQAPVSSRDQDRVSPPEESRISPRDDLSQHKNMAPNNR